MVLKTAFVGFSLSYHLKILFKGLETAFAGFYLKYSHFIILK
jgi:hypothetical protein